MRVNRLRGTRWGCALLVSLMVHAAFVWAGELRDPFVFGPRHDTTDEPSARPGLTGILWDAAGPLAIIGGEPFTIGDTVEDWHIVEIQPDHVVIQRDGRRETLVSGSALPGD